MKDRYLLLDNFKFCVSDSNYYIYLSVYISVCPLVGLSVCVRLYVCMSVCLSGNLCLSLYIAYFTALDP